MVEGQVHLDFTLFLQSGFYLFHPRVSGVRRVPPGRGVCSFRICDSTKLMSNVHPKGIPVTVTNIMMFQPLRSGFLVGLMGHKILLITYLVYCCSTVSNDKTPIKQMCPRWLDGAGRVPCYKMNLRQK